MKELILKQKYRVKEINPVYDSYFGYGKGWIFVSNFLKYSEAVLLKSKLLINSIYKYEIVDCDDTGHKT